jgi:hypothetical protein
MGKDRLIPDFKHVDMDTLTDALTVIMNSVEDALLQCGAIPGQDYSYKDLMHWAVELKRTADLRDGIEAAR